jgi:hypothetical protein
MQHLLANEWKQGYSKYKVGLFVPEHFKCAKRDKNFLKLMSGTQQALNSDIIDLALSSRIALILKIMYVCLNKNFEAKHSLSC